MEECKASMLRETSTELNGPVRGEGANDKRAHVSVKGFGVLQSNMDDRPELNTPKRQRPRCGARCRDRHPCRAPVVWDHENNRPRNGRCKLHGGLSTGPTTLAGQLRAKANLRQYRALVAE